MTNPGSVQLACDLRGEAAGPRPAAAAEVAAAGATSLRVVTGNSVFDIGSFSARMLAEFEANVDAHVTSTGKLELLVHWKKAEDVESTGGAAPFSIWMVVLGTMASTLSAVFATRTLMSYSNTTFGVLA